VNYAVLALVGVAVAVLAYAGFRGLPAAVRNVVDRAAARAAVIAPLTFFVTPGTFKALVALAPVVLGGAVVAAFLFGPVWGVLSAAGAAMLAAGRLGKREEKLQEALRRQLPDAMEAIAANARARSSIPTAMREAAQAAPTPLREVLADVVKSYDRAVVFHEALLATAARVKCRELNLAFDIVAVCFRQGSPLDEVSRRLASTLRALHAFRTKIQNETSGARMGMRIMLVVPIAVLLMMSTVEGDAVSAMFHQGVGIFLVLVAGVLMVTAWVWGRSILRSYL
jgi:Flp pilus assembly protein TadB